MKGIFDDLGEMKIPLNPNAKHVKQWSYRINPSYKGKVKTELEIMIEVGIIETIE